MDDKNDLAGGATPPCEVSAPYFAMRDLLPNLREGYEAAYARVTSARSPEDLMKATSLCVPVAVAYLLAGCASQPLGHEPSKVAASAAEPAPFETASAIAADMAAAMAADPESISPDAAALASLMANAVREASEEVSDESDSGPVGCLTIADPAGVC